MADAGVAQVFQNLAAEMGNVSTALGAQDRIKRVAYQASRGPVSDFVCRYSDDHPQATWNDKTELSNRCNRFSEVTDAQHAFLLLRKVHQKPGETVQVYAERLITLAEDAFGNQQGPATQRQLIDIFVDGLSEDSLKLKILRENPATLEAAITTATNEQNLRRRFNLRTRHREVPDEERMEVDHYRPAPRCFKCHLVGHRSKDCRSKTDVNAVVNIKQPMGNDGKRDMLCWYCGRKGHFKRECRKRQAEQGRGSYNPKPLGNQASQEN